MGESVFIVLFRGVGGATQLPKKPLREALTEAGFRNVATYINSGNAVLATDLGRAESAAIVAQLSRERFGFEKEIFLVAREEWAALIEGNPFPEATAEPKTLHGFVLTGAPPEASIARLAERAAPHERVHVRGNMLYFHAPEGFGVSKLPPVIDRTLGVVSTARNWNTVLKLAQLAEACAND